MFQVGGYVPFVASHEVVGTRRAKFRNDVNNSSLSLRRPAAPLAGAKMLLFAVAALADSAKGWGRD
eukprot:7092644-Prymnesium_polylepis.1